MLESWYDFADCFSLDIVIFIPQPVHQERVLWRFHGWIPGQPHPIENGWRIRFVDIHFLELCLPSVVY